MYLHFCPAYEDIEVMVESMQEHINLTLRSPRSGSSISVTLSGPQVATIATALLDTLTAIGEIEDSLGIFGGAVRLGDPLDKVRVRKEAA